MANSSIFAAFERMWQHVTYALSNKSDISHSHSASDIGAPTVAEMNASIEAAIGTAIGGSY